MKEKIIIWSSKNNTQFDDFDTLKKELLRNRSNVLVELLYTRLIKDQGDIRTYEVDYEYVDIDNTHKNNVK